MRDGSDRPLNQWRASRIGRQQSVTPSQGVVDRNEAVVQTRVAEDLSALAQGPVDCQRVNVALRRIFKSVEAARYAGMLVFTWPHEPRRSQPIEPARRGANAVIRRISSCPVGSPKRALVWSARGRCRLSKNARGQTRTRTFAGTALSARQRTRPATRAPDIAPQRPPGS